MWWLEKSVYLFHFNQCWNSWDMSLRKTFPQFTLHKNGNNNNNNNEDEKMCSCFITWDIDLFLVGAKNSTRNNKEWYEINDIIGNGKKKRNRWVVYLHLIHFSPGAVWVCLCVCMCIWASNWGSSYKLCALLRRSTTAATNPTRIHT